MSIVLMTDSGADYTKEEREQKNIISVPLNVEINGVTYLDGYDISAKEFYQKLAEDKSIFPKTSSPSPERFLEHFLRAKENGDTVIYVGASSALTSTYQNALIAKEMSGYDKIYTIDSLKISPPERMLVDYVKDLIDAGEEAEEIVKKAEAIKSKITVFAMIDSLEYIKKGGRVTRAEAALGDFIGLKPLVHLTEGGRLIVWGKALGKARAEKMILEKIDEYPPDENLPMLFLTAEREHDSERLREQYAHKHPECKIHDFLSTIGPAIGSHTGPGIIGVVYFKK